jgi:pimeloyl-ACP methyl ester carboxylesterase
MRTLHIETSGAGPAVALLHGSPTAPAHLRPLAERLASRYRTLLVHLPGYDASGPGVPRELAEAHALVEEALLAHDAREVHLVGFSGGAYRAFALAARGTLVVRSIAGIGAYAGLSPDEAAGLAGFAQLLRAGNVDPGPILAQRMLSPAGREHREWVDEVTSWAAAISPSDLADELETLARAPDLHAEIARLGAPLLLRVGELDVATPPAQSEAVAAVARRCTMTRVAGAGHALLCEDFDGTARALEEHLAAASG